MRSACDRILTNSFSITTYKPDASVRRRLKKRGAFFTEKF
jgi:hypothetical protein